MLELGRRWSALERLRKSPRYSAMMIGSEREVRRKVLQRPTQLIDHAKDDAMAINSKIRTSVNDPLRIGAVTAGKGQIGITLCPGKKDKAFLVLPGNAI